MRSSFVAAAALSAAAVLSAAAAPAARAESYNWMSPEEVQGAMEEGKTPAIFFFEGPQGPPSTSIAWLFSRADVIQVLKKLKFSCARIREEGGGGGGRGGRGGGGRGGGGGGGEGGYGAYSELARELGVQNGTALVVVAFDMKVLARRVDPIKHEDFLMLLNKTAPENRNRARLADETVKDFALIEKWIESKTYGDACRRLNTVLERGEGIHKKLMERAKELEAKLDEIGKERLAEGKRLLESGKTPEAVALLEDTASAFSRFDSG